MALFLTDDLLKSDKKRKKAPEGTAPAFTSINPTISLQQLLNNLEIVTNYHDIALRSLAAWSTTEFLMDPDTEPAPILIKALSTYNDSWIESGPHPMGPPRRILAKALEQWLHSQLPSDGPFAKYHATLTSPEDLEQRSANLVVAHSEFAHTLLLCQHGTRHSRYSPTGPDNSRTAKSFTMQLLPSQKPVTLPVESAAIPT